MDGYEQTPLPIHIPKQIPPQLHFLRSKSEEDTIVSAQESLPDYNNNDEDAMLLSSLPSCMKKEKKEMDTGSIVNVVSLVVVDSSYSSSSLELTMSTCNDTTTPATTNTAENKTQPPPQLEEQKHNEEQQRTKKSVRFSLEEENIIIIASNWTLTNRMKQRLWWSNAEQNVIRFHREKHVARERNGSTMGIIERLHDACRQQPSIFSDSHGSNNDVNGYLKDCMFLCSGESRGLENQIHPVFGCDQQMLRDEIQRKQKTFNTDVGYEVGPEERHAVLASISLRRSRHHKIFARLMAEGDSVALLASNNRNNKSDKVSTATKSSRKKFSWRR